MVTTAENTVRSKLDGLTTAVEAAAGHLDEAITQDAAAIAAHGAERLKLSGEHTIVALAGATGSGKSSLFNAVTDLELAGTGVRRPTTSWTLACAWGPDGGEELLEWMGIPARHQVSRMGMLDRSSADTRLDGLVLLDLPDHDSTEVSHHVEMERLVPYSDLLVWVLDPQKYADAAIHERFIRPMAAQADAMVVVLNQIDRVPFEQRESAVEDLRRVMRESGLSQVPVLAVSATRGDGVHEFKKLLAGRIQERSAARTRLETRIHERAQNLAEIAGVSEAPGINESDTQALHEGLAEAIGVDDAIDSLAHTYRRRGRSWVTWLPLSWRRRARHDRVSELTGGTLTHSDVTGQAKLVVSQAAVDQTVRQLVNTAAVGMKTPWSTAMHNTTANADSAVSSDLSETVAKTGSQTLRIPAWWYLSACLQWLLFAAFIAGAVWSAVDAAGVGEAPEIAGIVLPWGLGALGLVGGIIAALIGSLILRIRAKTNARRVDARLRDSIENIAKTQALDPVNNVLADYSRYRAGMADALATSH